MVEWTVWIVVTASGALVTVVGYFLKKQNEKIEAFSTSLADVKNVLKAEIKTNRNEIISLFQDVCHERQQSCGKLMDLKVDSLKKEGMSICHKITTIREDRTIKWASQDKLNDDIRRHLARENNK